MATSDEPDDAQPAPERTTFTPRPGPAAPAAPASAMTEGERLASAASATSTGFPPSGTPAAGASSVDAAPTLLPSALQEPSTAPPGAPAATVFMPTLPPHGGSQASASTPPLGAPPASPVWDAVLPEPVPYVAPPAPPAPGSEGRIGPGVVLNHIYEVRRFIARGGMGEVYEGVNVNTDERVAIKVILSHLAMDPAVQAMFRKEARTLTRLSHPGLVQYRVLAQEPVLGVLYIVTDYIDGGQLSDAIGDIHPGADELAQLLRRLAAGLAAAHELGAIHRDISPDNVLLPGGRLDQAKIIDFGIAKDLDASSKTIVGDGFAGKLGFVAPEQFGDFDRQIGSWTDVYSLALVLLTVAAGRPVDMGATLVDAIEKRRNGPDLAPVPEVLRPVFQGMLQPNPLDRLRTMQDVLDALDLATGVGRAAPAAAPPPVPPPPPVRKAPVAAIAAGVAGLLAVGGLAAVLMGRHPAAQPAPIAATGASVDVAKVRAAVEQALPGAACTWLDISGVDQGPDGVGLHLTGVAGSPAAAQARVQQAAAASGVRIAGVDAANVFPVAESACQPLDAFRRFRVAGPLQGRLIASRQSNWELMNDNPPCKGPNAKVVVDLRTAGAPDFTVIGVDRKGGLQQLYAGRAALQAVGRSDPELVADRGGGDYTTTACFNETGLVGEALVTGPGPFPLDLPDIATSDKSRTVDAGWIKAFDDKATAGGWKTAMTWYRVVNDQPG